MIEYYESATHLNISFNKHIGTRGWQAAAHMMRKVRGCSHLREVTFAKQAFGEKLVVFFYSGNLVVRMCDEHKLLTMI